MLVVGPSSRWVRLATRAQVASRIASQAMSSPRSGTMAMVKRILRYLAGKPRLVNKVEEHWGEQKVVVDQAVEVVVDQAVKEVVELLLLAMQSWCGWIVFELHFD